MTRVVVLALGLLAAPSLASAAVEVRRQGTRVSVHVQSAALPEVLERLSKELGMKVVYEGARPQTLVNATIDDRTPAEAVLSVLEGLGLNFLARMDVTGSRVEHLVIAGTAGSGATAAAAPSLPRPSAAVIEDSGDEEDPEQEEPAPEDTKVERLRPGAVVGNRPRPLPAPGEAPAGTSLPTISLPSYPVSPFAPAPPAPPTVVMPPAPEPVEEPDDDSVLQ